jgi:phosphoglucosamine mutase
MSHSFLKKFFSKLNIFLKVKKIRKVIIGYDTRNSFNEIIIIILKELNSIEEVEILDRPTTTPCINFLAEKFKNEFLIMITASHFSDEYNGFKFFYRGNKLSKKLEKRILNIKYFDKKKVKKKIYFTDVYNHYINFINQNYKFKSPKNLLIDFSNGGASSYINQLYFLKKLKKINYHYTFKNINKKCGSNYLHQNQNKKLYKEHLYCLAFDGDADRLVVTKKKYGIIESEKIFLIFIIYLLNFFKIKNVVTTKIINPDLINILSKKNIKVITSNVGDRNIINLKKKSKSILGFETSGHYSIINSYMDGLQAAALFIKILNEKPLIINEVLNTKFKYKLKQINLKKIQLKNFKIKKNNDTKVIIRKSIWENIYRVYIFYLPNNFPKISY